MSDTEAISLPVEGTIVSISCKEDDNVAKGQTIAQFDAPEFLAVRPIVAPVDCRIVKIFKGEQQKFADDEPLFLIKPCNHEIVFAGICTECSANLTLQMYKESRDATRHSSLTIGHTSRDLQIDRTLVEESSKKKMNNLIESKRLILLLDVDHTLIHATHRLLEQTVSNERATNPESPALHNLCSFKLVSKKGRTEHFHIKFRPHLEEFLSNLSEYFEIHLYTHGNRAYADQIIKLIDKEKKFINDRLITCDEANTRTVKYVSRLFPFSHRLVAIVDDLRVWPHDLPSLFNITPFRFFSENNESLWYDPESLKDDDLLHVRRTLHAVHHMFYNNNDKFDSSYVSDLLAKQRLTVLQGTYLVFSGVLSKDGAAQSHPVWLLSEAFGATCQEHIDENTTHVIIALKDTEKGKEGKKKNIFVVHISWLMNCFRHWFRHNEAEYDNFPDKYDHAKLLKNVKLESQQKLECYAIPKLDVEPQPAAGEITEADFDFGGEDSESDDSDDSEESEESEESSDLSDEEEDDEDEPPRKRAKLE